MKWLKIRIKYLAGLFVSGLVTAIFVNYLVTSFWSIVMNINAMLMWFQKSKEVKTIFHLARGSGR